MPLIKKLVPEGRLRDALERWHAIAKHGYRREYVDLDWPDDGSGRPRILLLADRPGWAFARDAQAVERHLSDRFDVKLAYAAYRPRLATCPFDLVYVSAIDEFYHTRFVCDSRRVIKEVAHLPTEEEHKQAAAGISETLKLLTWDAGTLTVLCRKLQTELRPYREAFLVSQGVETDVMRNFAKRAGALKLGFVGNIRSPRKGVQDILVPAAREYDLRMATGNLSLTELVEFYNGIDVICVSSSVEGGPLALLEGMACGCFPVTTDVGIVPELVENGVNGLIVERNVDAFREAFRWCAEHLDFVREAGRQNAELIARTRSWKATIPSWEAVFDHALSITT